MNDKLWRAFVVSWTMSAALLIADLIVILVGGTHG